MSSDRLWVLCRVLEDLPLGKGKMGGGTGFARGAPGQTRGRPVDPEVKGKITA